MDDGGHKRRWLVFARAAGRARWTSPQFGTTLGVGFLGGFTTFSTFSVQAFLDVEAGEPIRGLVLVLVTVAGGLAAAAAGYYLGRAVL